MEDSRIYELERFVLNIPLIYDQRSGRPIEDYSEFIENQLLPRTGLR